MVDGRDAHAQLGTVGVRSYSSQTLIMHFLCTPDIVLSPEAPGADEDGSCSGRGSRSS